MEVFLHSIICYSSKFSDNFSRRVSPFIHGLETSIGHSWHGSLFTIYQLEVFLHSSRPLQTPLGQCCSARPSAWCWLYLYYILHYWHGVGSIYTTYHTIHWHGVGSIYTTYYTTGMVLALFILHTTLLAWCWHGPPVKLFILRPAAYAGYKVGAVNIQVFDCIWQQISLE